MQRLSVLQLQNMILAFCSHIITQKEKINSINVFPVPDQDTGSNLAATFEKVKVQLEKQPCDSLKDLASLIERTALYSAQGNSGIIFTGFLAGFFETIQEHSSISIRNIAEGFKKGAQKARSSIESPKNGTILNVMDDVYLKMEELLKTKDISLVSFFQESFFEGQRSLARTTDQLAVLRESNVVDAGGLAFLIFLESFQEYLSGKKLSILAEQDPVRVSNDAAMIITNRYEVIFIIKDSIMDTAQLKEMLVPLGDSIDIIEISNSVKVHIHTDQSETVKDIASSLGEVVYLKLSDMKEEKVLELVDTHSKKIL